MNIYYVYAYLRKSDLTPYYIGKGKDDRAFSKNHSVSVPKDRTKIVFLEQNLTDLGACAIERRMIRWYGRKDLRTGILLNKTDGGDGVAGVIQSEETRRKRGMSNRGKKLPPRSKEHAQKISNANKGKVRSEEFKKNLSELYKGKPSPKKGTSNPKVSAALKGTIRPKVQCPHCKGIFAVNVIKQWHLDKCKEKK